MPREEGAAGAPPACNDPGRLMFYERVGRHFYDDSELAPFPEPLPCAVCGAPIEVGFVYNKLAFCAAQRSVTKKRAAAGAEPGTHGKKAFNERNKAALATPDGAYVIFGGAPVGPLPEGMTWRTEGTREAMAELYRRAFSGDLAVPAIFVEFGQNGGFEFAITESPDLPVRCGDDVPETIDAGRVRQIAAAIRAVGPAGLKRFNQLRRRLGLYEGCTPEEQDEYLALHDAIAAAGIDPATPPTPGEPAYRIASVITATD